MSVRRIAPLLAMLMLVRVFAPIGVGRVVVGAAATYLDNVLARFPTAARSSTAFLG
ncbi:MAG: hypothetical protein ACR2OO_10685 [Thermomicrobiales bacterium]